MKNVNSVVLGLMLLTSGCTGLAVNPDARMCIDSGFTADQQQSIEDAATEWHDRTGEVNFAFVSTDCDVNIQAVAHLKGGQGVQAVGTTSYDYRTIQFDVDDVFVPSGYTPADYSLREIALHEFGHYLSGPSHSSNPADIMYGKAELLLHDGEPRAPRHLSDADVERVLHAN